MHSTDIYVWSAAGLYIMSATIISEIAVEPTTLDLLPIVYMYVCKAALQRLCDDHLKVLYSLKHHKLSLRVSVKSIVYEGGDIEMALKLSKLQSISVACFVVHCYRGMDKLYVHGDWLSAFD